MRGAAVVLTALMAVAGCAPRPRSTPVAGTVGFVCDPPDARIAIDETDLGSCALWQGRGIALGPGAHRVAVSREGWLPQWSEVVPRGGRITVQAALRRVPE